MNSPTSAQHGIGVNISALGRAWSRLWGTCVPVAGRLHAQFRRQSVRFDSLPESKRYASTDTEHAEILRRHHVLLEALLDDTPLPGDDVLLAITCSWSATSEPTARDELVARVMPEAVHWRSDDLGIDPGYHAWQHHFVARTTVNDPALDQLLSLVANDGTDGVILTDRTLSWLYHPFDGGARVITSNTGARDSLAADHYTWLPFER
ncbi:DUF3885 domain-containing protein [Qaidamihabitans albus]|uniref:DUF3885 domain-containing protein n=1 Tax=Qaidamihabitans albus TaxID=2795733 RepID=UPI0018F27364|nr:hypothetical protein [Qaidamihabitans albus]